MSSDSKPLVVVPADNPPQIADSPHLDRLAAVADVRVYRDMPADVDEQIARVVDAQVIINSRGHLHWRAETLARAPSIRMITTVAIGVDAVDLSAAAERDIVVSNVPGRTKTVVAEHALALMLATARRVNFAASAMKAGRWETPQNMFLGNKTLGVIGTGSIGAEMIRLSKAIGMNVQAWTFNPTESRSRELGVPFVELDQLLSTSDVISIHVKLTNDSRGLLGAQQLNRMKPGSLLVNTARGPVVDRDALVDALNSGHLGGAGLDVFDIEPLSPDDPLLGCEQIVVTPHTADHNEEGRDLLNGGAVDNVIAFLNGIPQNVVN